MLTPLAHWHTLDIVRAIVGKAVSIANGADGIQVIKCACSGLICAGGQKPNLAGGLVDKAVKCHCKISFSLIGGAVVVFTTAPLVYSTSKSLSK